MRLVMVALTLIICSIAGSASAETRLTKEESDKHCNGDAAHIGHDYPLNICVRTNNPHYATDLGGGEPCTSRSKTCDSCYNCCDLQKTEAENCHCFEDYCDAYLEEVHRTCETDCFGEYLDECPYQPEQG